MSFLGPLPDVLWEDSGPTGVQGEPTPAVRTPPTSLLSPTQPGARDNYRPSKTFFPSFA